MDHPELHPNPVGLFKTHLKNISDMTNDGETSLRIGLKRKDFSVVPPSK
jgi:hypothetical protein